MQLRHSQSALSLMRCGVHPAQAYLPAALQSHGRIHRGMPYRLDAHWLLRMSQARSCTLPAPFGRSARFKTPSPCDAGYEAKAWEVAMTHKGAGNIVFSKVAGAAGTM